MPLTALLLAVVGAAAADPSAWGTVMLPSRAPLAESRLGFAPGRMRVLAPHRGELAVAISQANVWAQMPGYFWDGEWTRLLVRGAFAVAPGLELRAELGLIGRSGGRLDDLIMGFHGLVGCTQARRDLYPRHRLEVHRVGDVDAKSGLGPRDAGAGLATPSLGVRRALWGGEGGQLTAGLAVGLPVGDGPRRFASARPALLGELLAEGRLAPRLQALGAFGATVAPLSETLYDMPLAPVQKFLLLGLRLQLGAHAALVAHWLTQDGPSDDPALAPLDRSTHEFVLGGQARLGQVVGELAVLENSIHDANTPDFGLHLGLRVPL